MKNKNNKELKDSKVKIREFESDVTYKLLFASPKEKLFKMQLESNHDLAFKVRSDSKNILTLQVLRLRHVDFTLSNTRQFYLSSGAASGMNGLTT